MPADPHKTAAGTPFDSVKNYTTATGTPVTFSGSIAAGDTQTRTVTIPVTRTEDTVVTLLYNYSGSPNTAARWKFGYGPVVWGAATLDGGWGTVAIKTRITMTASLITVNLDLFNGDGVSHSVVTPVVVTVVAALYAVAFS